MRQPAQRPIADPRWVLPKRLLAGEYPRNGDDASSVDELAALLAAGVTFFLALTEEGEYDLLPYHALLEQVAAATGRRVQRRRCPFPSGETPTPPQMRGILQALARGH
ncbi:MAG: hypothetical protein GX605_09395, partial [Chloroflexi bacterium]|nr:hypothetical protein [Chloroflexota bacterium]